MNQSNIDVPIDIRWNRSELALVMNAIVLRPFYEVFKLVGKLNKHSMLMGNENAILSLHRSELKICLLAMRDSQGTEYNKLLEDLNIQLTECGVLGGGRG